MAFQGVDLCGRRQPALLAPSVGPRDKQLCFQAGFWAGCQGVLFAEHGVEGDDELSHGGEDGELGGLSVGGEALKEAVQGMVLAAQGGEGGHVEDLSHVAAAGLASSGS